ncbi:hypothetical protein CASFOL_005058 [Castilleja foliolosa]|uniref:Exopolygalacturonase-like n=1 Tax=Castilleja foliolosa TaxID=1961234 RepID=A0ABD3E6D8_9LAMI
MTSRAIALALLVLCSALVSCNAAGADYKIFNVLDFGAKPGKPQESTDAFMQTWEATCGYVGNAARMFIPPGIYTIGQVVFQGPCKSQMPVVILLQGTLQAVSDVSAYPEQGWIQFEEINGLVLTGGGIIDGLGQNVWQYNDCKTNPTCTHLPATIYMSKVNNAKIKSIKIVNSMGFNIHITQSYLVRLHSLVIDCPEDSPNTDGLHISKSNTIKVSRSVIKTGDDCISVGQGSTNITVNKLTCGPGHGISVGSLGKRPNEMDVRGLIVKNCTLIGTTNGIRIKTWPDSSPSEASGMMFKDIIMQNVKNPIVIDQNYGSSSSKMSPSASDPINIWSEFRSREPSLVKIKDIIFKNIKGTTISPVAVDLTCSATVPCQNMLLQDIDLQHIGNEKVTSTCVNAKAGYFGVQNPPPC